MTTISHFTRLHHLSPSQCDNSDQGSIDSDYTSCGSSKVYGQSGSNSSLHYQGRSHSIESNVIPTRHQIHRSKSTIDPLQFVKIHRNPDQIILIDSKKPDEQRRQLSNDDDEQNDWTKVNR